MYNELTIKNYLYFELRGREEKKKQRARKKKSKWAGHPSTHLTSNKNQDRTIVTTHNDAKRSRIVNGQKRIQGLERCRIEDRITEKTDTVLEARLWFIPFLYHLWKLHDIQKHVLIHYAHSLLVCSLNLYIPTERINTSSIPCQSTFSKLDALCTKWHTVRKHWTRLILLILVDNYQLTIILCMNTICVL